MAEVACWVFPSASTQEHSRKCVACIAKLSSSASTVYIERDMYVRLAVLCFYPTDGLCSHSHVDTHRHPGAGVMEVGFSSSRILKHKLVNKQNTSWFLFKMVLPRNFT